MSSPWKTYLSCLPDIRVFLPSHLDCLFTHQNLALFPFVFMWVESLLTQASTLLSLTLSFPPLLVTSPELGFHFLLAILIRYPLGLSWYHPIFRWADSCLFAMFLKYFCYSTEALSSLVPRKILFILAFVLHHVDKFLVKR